MFRSLREAIPHLILWLVILNFGSTAATADIVVSGGFGSNGDLGFVNSPPALSISFGDGQGTINQLDGFVHADNADLGGGLGISQDLSSGPPLGLGFSFTESQPTSHQLLLSYVFVNNTGAALANFQFLSFVDPDIGPNFADESATVTGSLGNGKPGSGATSYQVGDPQLSTMFTNLTSALLGNVNQMPSTTAGDVSIALGFNSGKLGVGQAVRFQVLLADDGSSMGGLTVNQTDPVDTSDTLTVSGITSSVTVPEPSSIVLIALGGSIALGHAGLRLRRRERRRNAV